MDFATLHPCAEGSYAVKVDGTVVGYMSLLGGPPPPQVDAAGVKIAAVIKATQEIAQVLHCLMPREDFNEWRYWDCCSFSGGLRAWHLLSTLADAGVLPDLEEDWEETDYLKRAAANAYDEKGYLREPPPWMSTAEHQKKYGQDLEK